MPTELIPATDPRVKETEKFLFDDPEATASELLALAIINEADLPENALEDKETTVALQVVCFVYLPSRIGFVGVIPLDVGAAEKLAMTDPDEIKDNPEAAIQIELDKVIALIGFKFDDQEPDWNLLTERLPELLTERYPWFPRADFIDVDDVDGWIDDEEE